MARAAEVAKIVCLPVFHSTLLSFTYESRAIRQLNVSWRIADGADSPRLQPAFSDAGADSYWCMVRKKNSQDILFSDSSRYLKIPRTPRMFRVDALQASTLTKKVLDT
ncbi:MAG: hypothetical protein QOE55_7262 [Acidobacteriaceae bacterium]|nr:hypothetical protein [Acidobacteriaceae bacterium]